MSSRRLNLRNIAIKFTNPEGVEPKAAAWCNPFRVGMASLIIPGVSPPG
jgi:hypothetical protein